MGMYSLSGEYAYDRPFLWGSKRTGPDLMRVGNYRTTDWHENHMWDPLSVVPGSIMPPYDQDIDGDGNIDVPLGSYEEAKAKVLEEAKAIAADMKNQAVKDAVANGQVPEIVALIAYLNSLK